MSHPLRLIHSASKTPTAVKRDGPVPPQWPSYSGTSQFVGTNPSGRVSVYVDPSLGQPALQNARDLVTDADRVVDANDEIFGTTGGPVSVIVFALGGATDGTGSADHMGCDYTTGAAMEVCASFGNSARVSALFEAMLSECSMGGNLCSVSTGEALSRWCAAVIGNNALADFAAAPTWVQDGMPNWVDHTEGTDQDFDSVGCGMAFLSWLMSQRHGLDQIAQTMVSLGSSGTLAQLYANLTSNAASNAWPTFSAAVRGLSVTNDDPFGALVRQLGTLQIMLADEISACQLQALLAVSDQVYLNALSVQRTKEAPEKVFPDDYAPEPDEDLWINRLEIGTPNLLELIGNLHPLTVLAEYLSTAFVGAKVLETLARARKEWAQASSIKTATERVLHASDAIAPQPPPKVHLAPSKKVSRNKQMDAAARSRNAA